MFCDPNVCNASIDLRPVGLFVCWRYLSTVFQHLKGVLEEFRPNLVIYDAGVDSWTTNFFEAQTFIRFCLG